MNCRFCEGQTHVIDTATEDDCVIRRRKCRRCGCTFLTIEIESFEKKDATRMYMHRKGAGKTLPKE